MGGKGKKKGKKAKKEDAGAAAPAGGEEGEENGEGNGNGKKGKKGKKGKAGKSSKFQGDIFSEAAMENAYYVCHNLMDLLKVRKIFYRTFFNYELKHFLDSWIRLAGRTKEEEKGQKIIQWTISAINWLKSGLIFI